MDYGSLRQDLHGSNQVHVVPIVEIASISMLSLMLQLTKGLANLMRHS